MTSGSRPIDDQFLVGSIVQLRDHELISHREARALLGLAPQADLRRIEELEIYSWRLIEEIEKEGGFGNGVRGAVQVLKEKIDLKRMRGL